MPTASSSSSTRTGADRRAKVIAEVERWYRPQKPDLQIQTRKQKFEAIAALARHHCAWVTSVPGAADVRIETLPGSSLPDELRELGLKVERDAPETGERIISGAIIETAMRGPDGKLVSVTEGSTLPTIEIKHSGIVRIERWRFALT